MASHTKSKKLAMDELKRIIEFCQSIEEKGLDPFSVDVKDLISVIRAYFPSWDKPEEFCLDAEAINKVASVIKMQSDWIKHRATSLYRDPFLIEEKLRSLPSEKIAELFLQSWRPVIELEHISLQSLQEAKNYWDHLPPLEGRWSKVAVNPESVTVSKEEMIRQGVLSGEAFSMELEKLWEELKNAAEKDGRVQYWKFIFSQSYEETIKRAYLTSFLVTYGYATLEIHPLEEKIFIRPSEKPAVKKDVDFFSFPISISFEEWVRWKQSLEA
ncbi:MAG: hypothetical protein RMJ07_06265 [Nitrososphaerota archaeon]|nr:hypothetical protein [Candidatus Bathyarchaeota archaeon]MDW8049264.1 hypothetical protein [Nitrososphaerota archaeon]